jgi:hypothetical protein
VSRSICAPTYYFEEPLPGLPVIYFAGPTWHSPADAGWQVEGAEYLEAGGYRGSVCIPMPRDGQWRDEDSDRQIEWQLAMQELADVVLFWVPRPGLVTFVEFGNWYESGKVVLGAPPTAEKVDYLRYCAHRHHVPVEATLPKTIDQALDMIRRA